MFKASKAVRMFFFNTSLVATAIIWWSLQYRVSWLAYSIPGIFLIAAITGICPGMGIARKLVGEK